MIPAVSVKEAQTKSGLLSIFYETCAFHFLLNLKEEKKSLIHPDECVSVLSGEVSSLLQSFLSPSTPTETELDGCLFVALKW